MLTCYSFVFETKKGAVFYSADTRVCDNLLNFVKNHDAVDRIYMEVTDLDVPGDIHLNINHLIECVDESFKDKIWMMHLRADSCIEKVLNAGFKIVDCSVK